MNKSLGVTLLVASVAAIRRMQEEGDASKTKDDNPAP